MKKIMFTGLFVLALGITACGRKQGDDDAGGEGQATGPHYDEQDGVNDNSDNASRSGSDTNSMDYPSNDPDR